MTHVVGHDSLLNHKRDDILQKRPIILSILPTVVSAHAGVMLKSYSAKETYKRDYILQKRPEIFKEPTDVSHEDIWGGFG